MSFTKALQLLFIPIFLEQEYFLVDEALYNARPDPMLTGHTLMDHDSAKNQQMDDLYSSAIPEIPELLIDNTDCNPTYPFAFTGNRFEFRAVGCAVVKWRGPFFVPVQQDFLSCWNFLAISFARF